MIHKFELSVFYSAWVWLVLTLHQEVPTVLLHPVVARWGWDIHGLLSDLELTALVVLDSLHITT